MNLTRSHKAWAVAAALLVAACGGGGGVVDAVSRFGTAFAQSFRADPASDPTEPGLITFAGAAGPVLTEEPVDI